jgi:glycosylphosphatidylinositol transamidase (GPIT) subunit GPI8
MLIITILTILAGLTSSQKAFIMSSSVGYYNYRQQANAM